MNRELHDHVGGGMSCPPTEFEWWRDRNTNRRYTGAVVRGGRRLFDPRLARAQLLVDFARWKQSTAPRPVVVAGQPVGRFFPQPRKRAKRPAASPAATGDPDGGHAIGGAS